MVLLGLCTSLLDWAQTKPSAPACAWPRGPGAGVLVLVRTGRPDRKRRRHPPHPSLPVSAARGRAPGGGDAAGSCRARSGTRRCASVTAAKGGCRAAGGGRGGTAPAMDGDDNGEHVAGGDGAWYMQGAGTVWRAHGVQQRGQHNVAGLPISQLIKEKTNPNHCIIMLFLLLLED